MNKLRNRGFTLVELVIVLAVLAILAAVAVNSYRDYVLRSGRAEAMTGLKELAQRQEEYYGNQQTYAGSVAALDYAAATPNGLYQLQISASSTTSYTLQATAINSQLDDEACRTFTLTGMGRRTAVDSGGSDATQTCWQG